jgi:hypothetical protein
VPNLVKNFISVLHQKKFGLKIFFRVLENPNGRPGNPYRRGRLSTVGLLIKLSSFVRNKIFFRVLEKPIAIAGNPY